MIINSNYGLPKGNVYYFDSIKGWTLEEYCKLARGSETFLDVYLKDKNINKELINCLTENWDNIIPFTIQEALSEDNVEKRRVIIKLLNPEVIFNNIKSTLLDEQTIIKNRLDGSQYKDTFRLYSTEGKELGLLNNRPVYFINFRCPSTDKEYWQYCEGPGWKKTPNAIDALLTTFRTQVKEEYVKYFIRHGDILLTIADSNITDYRCSPRRITREEYLNKFVLEV